MSLTSKIIKDRRSIRKFKENSQVSKEQIHALLEAGMMAPSACNSRPWRFLVITNRELLDKVAECHHFAKMLQQVSVAIVIVALAEEQAENEIARGFYPQDCGAATQNILLQAQEMGLGTCWCGVYPKEHVIASFREMLNLPEDETPMCIIAVGEADEAPAARGFYESEKVRWMN